MSLWMIFALLCIFECIFFKIRYTRRNGPPVWCGLPFVGYAPLFLLPKSIYIPLFHWFLKNAPDVLVTRHFQALVIVKNDYLKEVQLDESCLNRAGCPLFDTAGLLTTGKDKWVFFDDASKDLDWRSHRKVNVMALYNLKKRQSFARISDVVDSFLGTIKEHENQIWNWEDAMTFNKFQESGYVNLGRTFEVNNVQSFISFIKVFERILPVLFILMYIIPLRLFMYFEKFLPRVCQPRAFGRVYKELLRRILETKTHHQGEARDYIDAVSRVKKDKDDLHFYLREVALFNMVATTTTTQHSTMSTIAYLAVNPQCQQRAFQEIKSIVGSSMMTYDHLAKMDFLKAVVHESLRISPPIPMVQRCSTPSTKLGNYVIPACLRITLIFHSEAYDERNFKDHLVFKPSRFLDEDGAFKNDPNVSVFSRGKRSCPGQELAILSTMIYAAKILQHFEVMPGVANAEIVPYDGGIVPALPNIPMRFVSRKDAPPIRSVELESGLTAILNDVVKDDDAGKLSADL